jgi:DNA polymerase-3 subunit alpha
MLIAKNMVPSYLDEEKKCYNFTKYIRKFRDAAKTIYELDEVAQEYFFERFPKKKATITPTKVFISSSWWDSVYNSYMNKVRTWMQQNQNQILESLNNELFAEEFNKYGKGDILDWELQALHFFYSGHPLANLAASLPFEIDSINDIKEGAIVGHWNFKGKIVPEMKLYTIAGTVIDKDKVKSLVTLSTPDGVIDIKLFKQQYAKYIHETKGGLDVDEDSENYVPNDENYFEKGSHLIITGVKRGNIFTPKTYKRTGRSSILKVVLDENRQLRELRWKD